MPISTPVTVRAIGARASSIAAETNILPEFGMARAELLLAETASRNAVFAGVVATDSTKRALPGAEVTIPALGLSVRADARGEFRLTDVPPGTHTIVARSVGYSALETQLTFAANQTDERTLHLSRVTVLDSVVTTAVERRMSSFEENRRIGLGKFFTREDLDRVRGQSMASVMRGMSGVTVLKSEKSNDLWAARSRGPQGDVATAPAREDSLRGARPACYAHVWIDGAQVYRGRSGEPLFNLNSINPEEIEALEYYRGPSETPSKYSTLGSTCGVMVIWTRR